jgi:hypothetical protein
MRYRTMSVAVFYCASISLLAGCSGSDEFEAPVEDASSTDIDTGQPTADESTPDTAEAHDSSATDLSNVDAVEGSSNADAGCEPVRAYPVVEDADGNRCADLLGPTEEIGCADPDGVTLDATACYEDPVAGKAWITPNVRDELLEQGFRRCESFGGSICD